MDWILPEGGWLVHKVIQVKSDLPKDMIYLVINYSLVKKKSVYFTF